MVIAGANSGCCSYRRIEVLSGPSARVTDPRGNSHVGASASTKVKRTDFGVGGANPMVGEDITITIDVELVHPAAKK